MQVGDRNGNHALFGLFVCAEQYGPVEFSGIVKEGAAEISWRNHCGIVIRP
jgi:hypothetical protein